MLTQRQTIDVDKTMSCSLRRGAFECRVLIEDTGVVYERTRLASPRLAWLRDMSPFGQLCRHSRDYPNVSQAAPHPF